MSDVADATGSREEWETRVPLLAGWAGASCPAAAATVAGSVVSPAPWYVQFVGVAVIAALAVIPGFLGGTAGAAVARRARDLRGGRWPDRRTDAVGGFLGGTLAVFFAVLFACGALPLLLF